MKCECEEKNLDQSKCLKRKVYLWAKAQVEIHKNLSASVVGEFRGSEFRHLTGSDWHLGQIEQAEKLILLLEHAT